jgi:glutathione S-transferase
MLTIYHVPMTRSLRVVWLCEEMGIPYGLKTETFGQPSPEFLEANPLGAFPAIRDGDVLMAESTAILQYLTGRYGPTPLALQPDHPRYADYLQFVTFGEASLAAYLNPVLATQFRAPPDQQQNATVDLAKGMFLRRLAALERQLAKDDHLAGEFTAADISVGYALGLGESLGLRAQYPPPVNAYFDRLRARPALQAAMAK